MIIKTSAERIYNEVCALVRRCGTRDPAVLAREKNILTAFVPMGTQEGCCKGFFIRHCRISHITVNSDLPGDLQRVVLAHELGHALLHSRSISAAGFQDAQLYRTADPTEYEANLFAAELLLTDEDVLDALSRGLSSFQAAALLDVPAELLDFKVRSMQKRGCPVKAFEYAQSDFLKNLSVI